MISCASVGALGMGSLPRLMLGTSPFLGAGQFGERAYDYLGRFYGKPERIAKIIDACWDLGVEGIQLIPESYIVEALKLWEKRTGNRMVVVSSIYNLQDMDRLLEMFEHAGILLHASLADRHNRDLVASFVDHARERGVLGGLVSHVPYRTLLWASSSGIRIDVAMVPINKMGYMMDAPLSEIARVIKGLGCQIIAKKVLAAGRLPVREALEYVCGIDFIDSLAIGVSSVEEAIETFGLAKEYMRI